MSARLRVGLVGYGAFGRLHARCLEAIATDTGSAELAAICCRGEASAARARADFPAVRIYRDYRELVRAEDIDIVDVVVPNHLHAEVGAAALAAGKDIFLEKPMANTVADCDRLLRAAGGQRLINLGFELRVSKQWGAIKRLIDDDALGAPRFANISLFRHPYRQGADGWRYDPARVGSWILEEPVHFFDLLMWYFESCGDPLTVRASGTPAAGRDGDAAMYDNFSTVLSFPGGAYATLGQSLAGFGHHLTLELVGSRGALRSWWSGADARSAEPGFELQLLRAGAETPETIDLAFSGEVFELEEQLRQALAAFAERRTLVSGVEGRKRVLVCLAAEQSLRRGEAVELSL